MPFDNFLGNPILSGADLLSLTGRHTKHEQAKWLRVHDVPFRKHIDGSIVVLQGDEKKAAEPFGGEPRGFMTTEEIVAKSIPYKPECGIYFLIRDGEIVYVGQSTNYHSRINSHVGKKVIEFDAIAFVRVARASLNNVEAEYIARLKPLYNRSGKPKV